MKRPTVLLQNATYGIAYGRWTMATDPDPVDEVQLDLVDEVRGKMRVPSNETGLRVRQRTILTVDWSGPNAGREQSEVSTSNATDPVLNSRRSGGEIIICVRAIPFLPVFHL